MPRPKRQPIEDAKRFLVSPYVHLSYRDPPERFHANRTGAITFHKEAQNGAYGGAGEGLQVVRDFIDKNGYSPSYEEICRHLGLASKNSVAKHMRQLEDRGYLKSMPGRRRSLELIPVRTSSLSIPFLGIVTAGIPIEAIEVPESIDVPESFLGNGNNFALRVRGDSMIDEGIRDGDIIVIGKQPSAENGQTVVAMIRGEATVKKFHRGGDRIELRPANHAMKPIYATEDEVEIVGVVVGLLRDYKHRSAL